MSKRFVFPLVLLLVLSGCAGIPLSKEALNQVDPSVDYAEVKANPERFRGSTLLLGGQILDDRTSREGSTLEVLRYYLDNSGRPIKVDEAGGRFLVRTDRFLDPKVYEKGEYITLTGTVLGQETRSLNGVEYAYPLFRLGEAHIWKEPMGGYYGYPGYYGPYGPPYYNYPFYDPYWYPFGPPYYRYPLWDHRRPWW